MTDRPRARLARQIAVLAAALLLGGATRSIAQPSIPPLTGRVVDHAGVLSTGTEDEITALLRDHEAQTGNQVAVLTIRTLGGARVEEYALDVARSWQLGTSRNDNGVLFLLAIDDREMRIEVGYGLEEVLPDVVASRILRHEVRPFLRKGDFDGGVAAGAMAILAAIDGAYEPGATEGDRPPFMFGILFLVIPSIFAFLGVLSAGCARWFFFVFLMPFFWVAGRALTWSTTGAWVFLALYVVAYLVVQAHPSVRKLRETMEKEGSVKVGPIVIGGGGFGGSSGGFSSGGGFSGGGGSFGGGGASGSW